MFAKRSKTCVILIIYISKRTSILVCTINYNLYDQFLYQFVVDYQLIRCYQLGPHISQYFPIFLIIMFLKSTICCMQHFQITFREKMFAVWYWNITKFVRDGPIAYKSALPQVTAWRLTCHYLKNNVKPNICQIESLGHINLLSNRLFFLLKTINRTVKIVNANCSLILDLSLQNSDGTPLFWNECSRAT